MCGIAGFIDFSNSLGADELTTLAQCMADAVAHRGPDDRQAWADAAAGVALGFRRLSILDLSPAGRQPMASASGRYVMVYNGEVYNFAELRRELEAAGASFRGHSDTEIMLAAVERWGMPAAVRRFNGMFAFALWDRQDRRLYLGRDRLGIKPLYYGWAGRVFVFGSELKCLRAHPAFHPQIDRDVLALYLRHNYIPAPYAIYQGVHKLLPGTLLELEVDAGQEEAVPQPYWSAKEMAERGVADPFEGDEAQAVAALDDLLRQSVRQRMIADVPLGAFLSGGVDSSTIVALMQAQSSRPVETFTIGFAEDDYNEARYAREVARHLGTAHTELLVSPAEALAVIPRLPALYDEPFADASQVPTFLVAQLARRHVTVSLSGDGGDELFGGYNRYFWTRRIWKRVGWMPTAGRRLLAGGLHTLSPERWQALLKTLGPLLPASARQPLLADKVQKLAEVLDVAKQREMYLKLVSQWKRPERVVPGAHEPSTPITDRRAGPNLPDFTQEMMYLDLITYLPDDILVKVDRASMGVSLEARVPFLDDHRLVEFAWRLPLEMKLRNGQGKWILRQVLYQYVPPELIERPKMGFAIPLDQWLRAPLREWAESLLDERRLRQEGYFDPRPVRQKWQEHLEGKRNWQYDLWDILMFQAWLAEQ